MEWWMGVQIIVLDKNKIQTLIKKTLTFISSASSFDKNSTEPRVYYPSFPEKKDYLGVK